MAQRFCPGCNEAVEDVGGFCRRGHDLRQQPPAPPMSELRAEIDRAFEEARAQVAAALAPAAAALSRADQNGAHPDPAEPPPSEIPPGPVAAAQPSDGAVKTMRPPPPPTVTVAPPEDVATEPMHGYIPDMFEPAEPGAATDPITAFSPAPHMDWGPERAGLLKRAPLLKRQHDVP